MYQHLKKTLNSLVVIDPILEDYQQLVQGVKPEINVLVLQPQVDAIAQITDALRGGKTESLQIICHGQPGLLELGNTYLDGKNIHQYSHFLAEWGVSEILIYSCNVAADSELLEQLSQLTGANIAASTQRVGSEKKGGTWQLNYQIGQVHSEGAFLPETLKKYAGVFVTFSPPTNYNLDYLSPQDLVAGDFDSDGNLDIAVSTPDSYGNKDISVLFGQPDGSFTGKTNLGGTLKVGNIYDLEIGDFDQDGFVDLAVAGETYNASTGITKVNVAIFLADGAGGLLPATLVSSVSGVQQDSIAVGDFNNDGNLDIANKYRTDGGGSQSIKMLLGNGDGTFLKKNTGVNLGFYGDITLADFNQDGKLDVATFSGTEAEVMLGDGSGGLGNVRKFVTGISSNSTFEKNIDTGDFNQDGKVDLVIVGNGITNYNSSYYSILLGNGNGSFNSPVKYKLPKGYNPQQVATTDFNQDGDLDLAIGHGSSYGSFPNCVLVLLGDTDAQFSTPIKVDIGASFSNLEIGDFNTDQLPDLAVGSYSNGLAVLENTSIIGTTADNNLKGNSSSNYIDGRGGNDIIGGNGDNDTLLGGNGDDKIKGDQGKDSLNGGSDNDTLTGGTGADILTGGTENDVFAFDMNAAFKMTAMGKDTITDFVAGTDKILLDKTTFTKLGSVVGDGFSVAEEFAVVNSNAQVSTHSAKIVYVSSNGNLYYNANGNSAGFGEGGVFAVLKGNPALNANDFMISN